jgi:glycosyltransferase involved in cell wall biosynthesis
MSSGLEVSVVMPCLDEADTVAACVQRARQALADAGIAGEVIVADNGSTDGSVALAQAAGARVVPVAERGYGAALMGGIEAAQGRFIIMGDADQSYDFGELPKFVHQLRAGAALVQGCRLPSGGGTVLPGAMPPLHRWFGNPMLSLVARTWFGVPVNDVYCGLRGFTVDFYRRIDQRCTGMEFATEMIIKASLFGERIAEVPITLHPDGRRSHAPHLRTFRDGWRTLRFFLLFSPRWLFLLPGAVLILLGGLGYAVALPGLRVGGVAFDVHTLLYASVAMIIGQQAVSFALFTKSFAIGEGLLKVDALTARFYRVATLERGLMLGGISLAAGLVLLALVGWRWRDTGFGGLDYATTLRLAIPGATLSAMGAHTMFASFFVSILALRRR